MIFFSEEQLHELWSENLALLYYNNQQYNNYIIIVYYVNVNVPAVATQLTQDDGRLV